MEKLKLLEKQIEKLRSYLTEIAILKKWDFSDTEVAGVSAALDELLLAYEYEKRSQEKQTTN